MELYKTFIPGTESWLDVNNNRAFLAGDLSVIANGISAYYTAAHDPKLAEIAKDIRTVSLPIGPVGKQVELYQVSSAVVFKYTKYPKAALEYLRFMFEQEQMNPWITNSAGYCCQTLKAYASNPVWTADPNNAPYAKASESLRTNGYAGPLGYASAAVMADYVLVDMFAEAVTGQQSPQDAMSRAEARANRYYRV
jgi:multiple sugar transport system substrate-binding protein